MILGIVPDSLAGGKQNSNEKVCDIFYNFYFEEIIGEKFSGKKYYGYW